MTANYTAWLAADVHPADVSVWAGLTPANKRRLFDATNDVMWDRVGSAPSGSPWTGTIATVGTTGLPSEADLGTLVDDLIDDFNGSYTLQLQNGSPGPSSGDQPRQVSVHVRDGVLVLDHELTLVGESTPFDPVQEVPTNHGIRSTFKLFVAIDVA